jgi:hypothetical protein
VEARKDGNRVCSSRCDQSLFGASKSLYDLSTLRALHLTFQLHHGFDQEVFLQFAASSNHKSPTRILSWVPGDTNCRIEATGKKKPPNGKKACLWSVPGTIALATLCRPLACFFSALVSWARITQDSPKGDYTKESAWTVSTGSCIEQHLSLSLRSYKSATA